MLNPRRRTHRRRHYRRNPPLGMFGLSVPPVKRILSGVAGMVATRAVPGYLSKFMTVLPTTGPMSLAVRALTAILLGSVSGKFLGRAFAEDFTFGGLLSVADDAGKMYVYPSLGLGAYVYPELSAYMTPQLGQYMTPGMTVPALGAYATSDYQGVGDAPSRLDPGFRL